MKISLDNITKYADFDKKKDARLRNISFDVEQGEFVSIHVKTSKEKRALSELFELDTFGAEGKLTLDGRDVGKLRPKRLSRLRSENIGYIYSEPNLIGHTNVYKNATLPLKYRRDIRDDQPELYEYAMTQCGFSEKEADELKNRPARELDFIAAFKTALARAVINDPDVLVAEEPTDDLSEAEAGEVLGLLTKQNALGRTLIVITSDWYTANWADRIIKIRDGAIEEEIITDLV